MEADETTVATTPSEDLVEPETVTATYPRRDLRTQMRVASEQSRQLGMIDAVEQDAAGDAVVAVVVRHGLLGRRCTRVPVERIKQVNKDSVVLQFSRADFRRLPREENR